MSGGLVVPAELLANLERVVVGIFAQAAPPALAAWQKNVPTLAGVSLNEVVIDLHITIAKTAAEQWVTIVGPTEGANPNEVAAAGYAVADLWERHCGRLHRGWANVSTSAAFEHFVAEEAGYAFRERLAEVIGSGILRGRA